MTTRLRAEAAPTLVGIDAVIDDVVLRTLEPAIAGLDRLFDSLRSEPADEGEPDGIDGLARRGPIDRLLSSEWLLATDAPDEFLRRYEQGELGYLKLGYAREQRPETALVLFDAGPGQLGLPRIAQLACLVVLARRATRVNAELRWGTLQDPARYLAAGLAAVDRFMGARTLRPPGELPLDAFVDDTLVVSAEPQPGAARQLLLIEDGVTVRAELIDR